MASISSVALGRTVGSATPAACMSSMKAWVKRSATSAAVEPSCSALVMILSSTSVTFCTNVTSKPFHSRYRRIVSNEMNVRALPMWMRLYTVGPQTYMPTLPSSIGSNGRLVRDLVS